MDQEVNQEPVEVVQQTPEQIEADAAFTNGYNKARGIAPPAEEQPAVTDEVLQDEPETQQAAAQPQKRVLVKDLQQELADMRAKIAAVPVGADPKEVRQLHGMVGELNRNILELQKQIPKAPPPVDEVAAALEEARTASADYPEMAGPIVKALEKLVAERNAKQQEPKAPVVDIAQTVSKAVSDAQAKAARDAIVDEHPDFDQVRNTREFWEWANNQPKDVAQRIYSTNSPIAAAKFITQFKESLKPAPAPRQNKQERLAGNVVPTGTAQRPTSTALPDDAGFSVGYNRVMKSRMG